MLAKTGAGCRHLELSLYFELMADARTLPLSPKWLKSSLLKVAEKPSTGGVGVGRPRPETHVTQA